jgi:hypothetical protein
MFTFAGILLQLCKMMKPGYPPFQKGVDSTCLIALMVSGARTSQNEQMTAEYGKQHRG